MHGLNNLKRFTKEGNVHYYFRSKIRIHRIIQTGH